MIRGIIFDCFGVLYQGSIGHLYELAAPDRRADLANLAKSSDYGYISREEFLTQAAELIDKSMAEVAAIMQHDHIRNQAMVDYVRSFRPHYKVAMLSNIGRGVMSQLFTDVELDELFDEVVLSSDVGLTKPDPAIYQLTAKRLGLAPEECIMIDDLESNITGAKSANMQGIVFASTSMFKRDMDSALAVERC